MNEVKENQWQLYGRCKDNGPSEECNAAITLPEQMSNLGFRNRPKTKPKPLKTQVPHHSFGMAIDANLAIDMIHRAYGGTKEIFERYVGTFHNNDKGIANDAVINLKDLLYGVAFNKTIILKILSQPNCEGIRSYLCAREIGNNKVHYSLVMVGVDINGYDLNFPPVEIKPPHSGEVNNSRMTSGVETKSMVGEYGNPPGKSTHGFVKGKPVNEHYYLLQQAIKVYS